MVCQRILTTDFHTVAFLWLLAVVVTDSAVWF